MAGFRVLGDAETLLLDALGEAEIGDRWRYDVECGLAIFRVREQWEDFGDLEEAPGPYGLYQLYSFVSRENKGQITAVHEEQRDCCFLGARLVQEMDVEIIEAFDGDEGDVLR